MLATLTSSCAVGMYMEGGAAMAGLWASDIIGGLLWAIGLGIEATADQQKYNFKMNPSNKGKFINTGKQDFLPIILAVQGAAVLATGPQDGHSSPCPF